MEQLKITGIFDNVTTKQDGVTTMRFKFPFSEIGRYTRLFLNIGKGMKAMVVNEAGEKIHLGIVSFKQLAVDREGEAKFTIASDVDGLMLNEVQKLIEQQISFYTKVVSEDEQ